MLLLLFYLGNERYALDSQQIVEVIPRVNLRKVYHAPDFLSGIFNYRGAIVPVIDLSYLIKGVNSNFSFSTRIIIVSYLNDNNIRKYLGFMAEKVTETFNVSQHTIISQDNDFSENNYLGPIILDEKGMIQVVKLESLITNSQSINLLPSQDFISDDTRKI